MGIEKGVPDFEARSEGKNDRLDRCQIILNTCLREIEFVRGLPEDRRKQIILAIANNLESQARNLRSSVE